MKNAHRTNRGQVLIIFVFAILGLIGMTGLAIDGGNIYSDRRHAQNAADTAALAASLKRNGWEKLYGICGEIIDTTSTATPTCSAGAITAAMNLALENGYNSNNVTNRVDVFSPPKHGPYSVCNTGTFDCKDYIEVQIQDTVDTWFAKVLGVRQLHNNVTAVARAEYSKGGNLFGGNSLVSLRPTSGGGVNSRDCGGTGGGTGGGGGDVYLGGSSETILSGGGIFVNSDNAWCAFKVTNTCPTVTLNDGATVSGIGGQKDGCPTPQMAHASDPYPYPPIGSPVKPIPPAACLSPYNSDPGVWSSTDSTFHFSPGHYPKLPPEKDTTLDPGVYCVDNLIKTTNSYKFIGDGVFIYVRPGGSFDFQGGTIKLVAPGMIFPGKSAPAPVAAGTKPYMGYLIYVDETDWFSMPEDCSITAQSDTTLTGVLYTPHCDMKITGTGTTVGLTAQVISYTLDLEGGAILTFTYDPDLMPAEPEENLIGISR